MLNWRGRKGGSECSIKHVSQRIFRHRPELLPAECDVLSILVQQGPRSFLSDVTVELRSLFANSVRDRNVVSWRLLSSSLLVLKEWKKSDSTDVACEFRPGSTEGTYLITYLLLHGAESFLRS
jgi:hypothetical protein